MSDIQQARDVLTKWKEGHVTPWQFDTEGRITDDLGYLRATSGADAALIVGTAGNPDLLDAIDELLADSKYFQFAALVPYAERIAAAILAADERMSA